MHFVVGLLLVAAACTDGGSSGEPAPDPITIRAARWSATSPPPARACMDDSDCGVFVVAPGDDPCCDITVTAAPMNVHFMHANAEWRVQNCSDVTCPPLALPGARPASCAFEGRCANRTCTNQCDPPAAPR